MTLFWIIAATMMLAGLLFVLFPLIREQRTEIYDRDSVNVSVYEDQVAELERDLKNSVLNQTQFDQAKLDLERNLLADVSDATEKTVSAKSSLPKITAVVLAVLVPASAVALYMYSSEGALKKANSPQAAAQGPMMGGAPNPEVMVARLAEKMKSDPQNGQGWVQLGRSYGVLGRFAEAKDAYANALKVLGETDAQLLADYAEVLALNDPHQQLGRESITYLVKAMQVDPNNQKALFLSGVAALQNQQFQLAAGYWKNLQKTLTPGTEDFQMIEQRIAEAESMAKKQVSEGSGATAPVEK